MALSKAELLEMVENTITTNGAKEITGASLNAALTAIIEAMGTGGGSGGGASVELVYADLAGTGEALTTDQRAANAAAYAKAAAAAESGTAMPLLSLDMSEMMTTVNGYPCTCNINATMVSFVSPEVAEAAELAGLALTCTMMMDSTTASITAVIDETGLLVIEM